MNNALTVSQISNYFKQIFDAEELLFNVLVTGEISGFSITSSTAYFTLKDETAQMQCVWFNADSSSFKNGDSVMVRGTPRYYVKGGKLNFAVNSVAKTGMGILYQKFLDLKQKLEGKGYFNESHKKSIPSNIKRIGVVTSKDGAVIQDIITVTNRRNKCIDIVLYPVKVQGVNAEQEIANGIKILDNYNVDVIVVARGGGSFEDLQPFNTEIIADAVYNCNKPIVSAVGHETDYTIVDFIADLRAPTPSAAAELLCQVYAEKIALLKNLSNSLLNGINDVLSEKVKTLINYKQDMCGAMQNTQLKTHENLKIQKNNLCKAANNHLEQTMHYLSILNSKLQILNPKEILKLGYATVSFLGKQITHTNDFKIDSNITIKLQDGIVDAKVIKINGDKKWITNKI